MPWSETSRMEERARFVLDALGGQFTMSELCYRYGISRKTDYKWVKRYDQEGRPGFHDRSRKPRVNPNATPEKIVRRIIKLRRKLPTYGPITLRSILSEKSPEVAWPCPSTIGQILKRAELVKKRRRRPARLRGCVPGIRPAGRDPD